MYLGLIRRALPERVLLIRALFQRAFIVILNATDRLAHHMFKYGIGAVKHLFTRTEIVVKYDELSIILFLSVLLLLGYKKLRAGIPEFVDALLHVTYSKYVRCFTCIARYRIRYIFLDIIAVLILVDDYLGILLS